jgi:hypothetical protein
VSGRFILPPARIGPRCHSSEAARGRCRKSRLAGCERTTTLFAAALISAKRDQIKQCVAMRRDKAKPQAAIESARAPVRYDRRNEGRKRCIAKVVAETRAMLARSAVAVGRKQARTRAQRFRRVHFETRKPAAPPSILAASRAASAHHCAWVVLCCASSRLVCRGVVSLFACAPKAGRAAFHAGALRPFSAILPPEVPLQRAFVTTQKSAARFVPPLRHMTHRHHADSPDEDQRSRPGAVQ